MPIASSSEAITLTTSATHSRAIASGLGGHPSDARVPGSLPRYGYERARLAGKPGRALVFIGFMGAGKTTVATDVAAALGVQAQDSDRLLEQELGHSIAKEFEQGGEASFRAAEERLVCRLLEAAGPGSVLALGGGSVLSERVRSALSRHLTVLLDIDVQAAWRRAGAGSGHEKRPLAADRGAFFDLHARRAGLYERLADA